MVSNFLGPIRLDPLSLTKPFSCQGKRKAPLPQRVRIQAYQQTESDEQVSYANKQDHLTGENIQRTYLHELLIIKLFEEELRRHLKAAGQHCKRPW